MERNGDREKTLMLSKDEKSMLRHVACFQVMAVLLLLYGIAEMCFGIYSVVVVRMNHRELQISSILILDSVGIFSFAWIFSKAINLIKKIKHFLDSA
jgi:hypothetical protein